MKWSLKKLSTKLTGGVVPTLTRKVSNALTKQTSTPKSPTTSTSATEVTGQAVNVDWTSRLKSSISVGPIGLNGPSDMVWSESTRIALDRPSEAWDTLPLSILPSPLKSKLEAIAEFNGWSIADTVYQIAQWMLEEEHPSATDGTVLDCITFYLENCTS